MNNDLSFKRDIRKAYPLRNGYRELNVGEMPDVVFDRISMKEVQFIDWIGFEHVRTMQVFGTDLMTYPVTESVVWFLVKE